MHNKEPPTLPYLVEPYEYDYEVQVYELIWIIRKNISDNNKWFRFSLEQGCFLRPSQTFR
jgi:hypothetical protein